MAKVVWKIKEGIKKEADVLKKTFEKEGETLGVDKEVREKFKKEAIEVRREFRRNMVTAITAAFAFVIALQWKDVITDGINYLIMFSGLPQGQAFGFKVVSAIAVTFIAVLGVLLTTRFLARKSENGKEESDTKGRRKKRND